MTKRLKVLSAFAVALLFLGIAPQAHATIDLTLINGATTISLTNCSPGCAYNGTVGGYSINLTSDLTGSSPLPIIDLTSVNQVTSSTKAGAGVLTILASANGFTIPAGGFTLSIGGTLSAGGTMTAALYGGTNNTLITNTAGLVGAHQVGSTLSFSTPNPCTIKTGCTTVFGNSTTGLILPSPPGASNPFALTIVTTLNFGPRGVGSASYDAGVDPLPVPEPAVVTLLGSTLLLTVGAIRRKTRRS